MNCFMNKSHNFKLPKQSAGFCSGTPVFIYLFCSIDPTAWGHHPTGYRTCEK
jgi:hypothetical protein